MLGFHWCDLGFLARVGWVGWGLLRERWWVWFLVGTNCLIFVDFSFLYQAFRLLVFTFLELSDSFF